MGLGQKFLGRVNFLWLGLGSAIYGLGLHLENFLLQPQIFQFFSLWVKKNLFGLGQKVRLSKKGQPLIYCGSKVYAGQGPSLYPKDVSKGNVEKPILK